MGDWYGAVNEIYVVGLGASDMTPNFSWINLLAEWWKTPLVNLAINGAVLGPAVAALGSKTPEANIVEHELPRLPLNAAQIVLFAAINDIYWCCIYNHIKIDDFLKAYHSDLVECLRIIKNKYPFARIIIGNSPDASRIPIGAMMLKLTRAKLAEMSRRVNEEIINPLASTGIKIVDFMNYNEVYDDSLYQDKLHPNIRGHFKFAEYVISQMDLKV